MSISLSLRLAHLREVLRHDLGDGVRLRLLLELAGDPGAFRPREDVRRRPARPLGQRPVVEIGRVVEVPRRAVGVELDVEHPLGDDAALAALGQARVLDRVLEVEEHARLRAQRRARPPAPRRAAAGRGGVPA